MTVAERVDAAPPLPRASRVDAVTLIVIAVGIGALALRLYDLGAKAIHHDESLHATYSWYFMRWAPGYVHDPLMHGPFQFHATAAVFKLFGDNDFTARVPAALAGTALVCTPLLLRRWLGAVGTVLAALFLALSPSLLYFSRFAREDIYIALWTALVFIAIWRYRDDGRDRWLALLAAGLALGFATKELVYLTCAIVLVYCDVALTLAFLDQRGTRAWDRVREFILLAPVAWLVVALWGMLEPWRARQRIEVFPRTGDLLIVVGVLTLPQLAAGVQIPLSALGFEVAGEAERRLGVVTVSALLSAAMIVGMFWDTRRWVIVSAIFYGITIPLFTTEFTNFRGGLTSDLWGALDYWIAQQDVRRGEQPWFYYLMMLPLYEFLTLLPAIIGGAWLLWRRPRTEAWGLTALLGSWAVGTFVALTYAGEKMPWLLVHLALPLALLAALALDQALMVLRARPRRDPRAPALGAAAGGAAVALLLLAVLSLRTGFEVSYAHPDTPLEPLIYTQTSPDVPELSRAIHELAAERAERRASAECQGQLDAPRCQPLAVIVDDGEGASWPWAWYLRDLPSVSHLPAATAASQANEHTLVLALRSSLANQPALNQRAPAGRPYRHRWWFPEEGYKQVSVEHVLSGGVLRSWVRFMADRVKVDRLGSLDGAALFPVGDDVAGGGAGPQPPPP
jgi:uncharacterized protein (TIGR03663 family)